MPAEPLGEAAQHGRHRVGVGRGGGQALLGLGDPAQFGEAGLRHQLPHRAGHPREGGPRRDLQQRQSVGGAGGDQGVRHRVVHRGEPEAEGGTARRDDPGDVGVEEGVGEGGVGELDPGREEQFAAEEIGEGVGHLGGVRPVDDDVRAGGTGELAQREVVPGEEGGEGDWRGRWNGGPGRGGRGRGARVGHGVHFLHSRSLVWIKRTLRSGCPGT
ncbi:hypothetical protein SRO_4700 [Streptomyces rochei]|nr:hypothetical protein SRO_4700 [Streptomyces rochei]